MWSVGRDRERLRPPGEWSTPPPKESPDKRKNLGIALELIYVLLYNSGLHPFNCSNLVGREIEKRALIS